VKFKLDENLPVSSAAILATAGHDVDTVSAEGLTGAADQDVVITATAAGRVLTPWTWAWAISAPIRPAVMQAL
jgi:predicted nuclease of predicted toxin-antitoxin system